MTGVEAVWLALAVATAIVLGLGKRSRKQLFGAVLTKGRKGAFGLDLTPVKKSKRRRKRR